MRLDRASSATSAYAGSYGAPDVVDAGHRQATAERVFALGGASKIRCARDACLHQRRRGGAAFAFSIVRALNGDLVAFAEGAESASDSTHYSHREQGELGQRAHLGCASAPSRNIVDGVEHAAMNASLVVDTRAARGRIVLAFKKRSRRSGDR